MANKIKLVATQLLLNIDDYTKKVERKPWLKITSKIGYKFTKEIIAKLEFKRGEFLKESKKKRI